MKPSHVEKFKQQFFETFSGEDYTEIEDVKAGFTLRGEYPQKSLKRMKIEPGYKYISFFNFYLDEKRQSQAQKPNLFPLVVGVGLALKVQESHSPQPRYILDEEHIKSKIHKPIDITSADDYIFDGKRGQFFRNKKNDKLSPVQLSSIKKDIFRLHLASYTSIVGLRARFKMVLFRSLPIIILSLISHLMGTVVWVINGQFYTFDPILEALTNRREYTSKEPIEEKQTTPIDFFGYKVATWTIASFSILVILFHILMMLLNKMAFLDTVNSLSILTISVAIIMIVLYDKIIPHLLRKAIRHIGTKLSNLKMTGLKLSV